MPQQFKVVIGFSIELIPKVLIVSASTFGSLIGSAHLVPAQTQATGDFNFDISWIVRDRFPSSPLDEFI